MNPNRFARIAIPLAVLSCTVWAIGGQREAATVMVILTIASAIMLPVIAYCKRTAPDPAQWSVGQALESLASFCSPRAILRSVSVGQALARTVMLVLFLPMLLLMPLLRRLT